MNLTVRRISRLHGEIDVPGDKSITHRALLLSALAEGPSHISGYLDGGDCRATTGCLRALGVTIDSPAPGEMTVHGVGLHGLREPETVLDCVRSGTTMRLLAGLLSGQPFYSVLNGDTQLVRRPMDRVVIPLRQMGATVLGRQDGRYPPLTVSGGDLHGIEYALPVASAQLKSSLLLAALYAKGETRLIEPAPSRDHTERMLIGRGVPLQSHGLTHTLMGPVERLKALDVAVPGDFSSAAFFIVAALLVENDGVLIRHVGINPTRTGLPDILIAMGARIEMPNSRDEGGEPVADLLVRRSDLCAVEVGGDLVPRTIDEFPILALAATQARGTTRVRDAAELRVKESDRIATTVRALRALGAEIVDHPDGFDVHGPTPLRGAVAPSGGDHRLAMTLAIAGLVADGETVVEDVGSISDSFPGFVDRLDILTEGAWR
jgi:3-phosphoshikimate 1-carboxyvinyltransferase